MLSIFIILYLSWMLSQIKTSVPCNKTTNSLTKNTNKQDIRLDKHLKNHPDIIEWLKSVNKRTAYGVLSTPLNCKIEKVNDFKQLNEDKIKMGLSYCKGKIDLTFKEICNENSNSQTCKYLIIKVYDLLEKISKHKSFPLYINKQPTYLHFLKYFNKFLSICEVIQAKTVNLGTLGKITEHISYSENTSLRSKKNYKIIKTFAEECSNLKIIELLCVHSQSISSLKIWIRKTMWTIILLDKNIGFFISCLKGDTIK